MPRGRGLNIVGIGTFALRALAPVTPAIQRRHHIIILVLVGPCGSSWWSGGGIGRVEVKRRRRRRCGPLADRLRL